MSLTVSLQDRLIFRPTTAFGFAHILIQEAARFFCLGPSRVRDSMYPRPCACHGQRYCYTNGVLSDHLYGRVTMLFQFSRWRMLRRNFTYCFGLGDVPLFRRSVSINEPDFVVKTQSTADI